MGIASDRLGRWSWRQSPCGPWRERDFQPKAERRAEAARRDWEGCEEEGGGGAFSKANGGEGEGGRGRAGVRRLCGGLGGDGLGGGDCDGDGDDGAEAFSKSEVS